MEIQPFVSYTAATTGGWVDQFWTKGECFSHPWPLLEMWKELPRAVASVRPQEAHLSGAEPWDSQQGSEDLPKYFHVNGLWDGLGYKMQRFQKSNNCSNNIVVKIRVLQKGWFRVLTMVNTLIYDTTLHIYSFMKSIYPPKNVNYGHLSNNLIYTWEIMVVHIENPHPLFASKRPQ